MKLKTALIAAALSAGTLTAPMSANAFWGPMDMWDDGYYGNGPRWGGTPWSGNWGGNNAPWNGNFGNWGPGYGNGPGWNNAPWNNGPWNGAPNWNGGPSWNNGPGWNNGPSWGGNGPRFGFSSNDFNMGSQRRIAPPPPPPPAPKKPMPQNAPAAAPAPAGK